MVHRDHVCAAPGDDLRDLLQLAGFVCQGNGEGGVPSTGHQAPGDDPAEDVHVNVSPGDDAHHLFPLDREFVKQHCGYAHGSGSFGDDLLFFQQGQDGGGNLILRDGDDTVHIL